MAYPPTIPSGSRINTTPQVDQHPADHTQIHAALTEIVNELGSNPSGSDATVTARLSSIETGAIPLGLVIDFAGSSLPSGWAFCDGTAVSRTTYSDLFTVIGTTYGNGDGSTTFNLPDARNRVSVAKGTASYANVLGETGGTEDAIVVTHRHGYEYKYRSVSAVVQSGSPYGYNPDLTTVNTNTDYEGSSGADQNLQPYIVFNKVMRLS